MWPLPSAAAHGQQDRQQQPRASSVADAQLSHPKGRASLGGARHDGRAAGRLEGAAHFSMAKPPTRWPFQPVSAAYLSIRSINKGLFLNSTN